MAVVNPCYKCEDRVVGCHCKCPKYIEFRAIMDQRIKNRVEYRNIIVVMILMTLISMLNVRGGKDND